tara:strand:- start:12 stop:230 length:219 start_codon:yes stop_codon:yes gene_type:complete
MKPNKSEIEKKIEYHSLVYNCLRFLIREHEKIIERHDRIIATIEKQISNQQEIIELDKTLHTLTKINNEGEK